MASVIGTKRGPCVRWSHHRSKMDINCSSLHTVRKSIQFFYAENENRKLSKMYLNLFRKRISTAFSVRVGSTHKRRGGRVMKIKRFYQHSRFNRNTLDYDFTLVELKEPLDYTEYIQPARLPTGTTRVPDGRRCLVSGWGSTENPGESPDILRSVQIPVVNQAYCNMKYASGVTDRMICAGFQEGGRDTCFGDSGQTL